MRLPTVFGLGLVLVGGLVLAASSGAFDLTSADREVGIETASDKDALVGIENDQVTLNEEQGRIRCVFCSGNYEYTDVELVTITDRTPSSDLEVTDAGLDISGGTADYPSLESYEIQMNNDEYTIYGTLRCDAEFSWWDGLYQRSDSTTFTMDLETSDGTITVELQREIPVQCV
ncbi:hypothetical protein HTG_14825 [Natrinema mahii]|nr:hypothetical protein HTG_14825 [Natrinema mahii]